MPLSGKVKIIGLTQRPELNGRTGVITGGPRQDGRLPVLVDNEPEPLAMKEVNLAPHQPDAGASATTVPYLKRGG